MGGAAVVFGAMRRSRAQSDYLSFEPTLAPQNYSAHYSAYYVERLGLAKDRVEALMSSPAGGAHLDHLDAIKNVDIRKKAARGDYLKLLNLTQAEFDIFVSDDNAEASLVKLDNIRDDDERHAMARDILWGIRSRYQK
jgi:hypothetical protein